MAPDAPPSPRTTVRRRPDRGRYDPATIHAILDEALVCHLGLVDPAGRPFVVPTIHARLDEQLYLHGSPASRAFRTGGAGDVDVCVTVTLLDGLVLARSAYHHAVNYRSVVAYGKAVRVDDPVEKAAALARIVEHVVAGRGEGCRPPSAVEVKGTLVLRVPLDEASAKIRTGGPLDDEADLDLPHWAGHIPLTLVPGTPVPAEGVATPFPAYDLPGSRTLLRRRGV